MQFRVKVIYKNNLIQPLEGRYDRVLVGGYMDEKEENLVLFQSYEDKATLTYMTKRIIIKLNDIDTLEVEPIYEDNGKTISSC